jgi:hypothetical protein
MRFFRERQAHLDFTVFAIAVVPMLGGVPLAFRLVMVAAISIASIVAFGITLEANDPRKMLATFNVSRPPQIIPDFTIRRVKYTESHSVNMFASKPFL